jgi:hypothetical protein
MSNKKSLLVGIAAIVIANSAIAGTVTTPTVTLSGYLKANYGYVRQEGAFKYPNLDTANSQLRNHHLTNETRVVVGVEDKTAGNITYGAKVVINADTSDQADENYDEFSYSSFSTDSRIAQQAHVYVSGNEFGRFTAGSYPGLVNAAGVSAECVDVAPVGLNGAIRHWINQNTVSNGVTATTTTPMRVIHKMSPGLYLDNVADAGVTAKNANKVSYQTSDLGGFFIAVDYIPDTQVSGTIASAANVGKRSYTASSAALQNDRVGHYYDVVRGAIAYAGQMNQDYAVKLALTGESGRGKATNNGLGNRIHNLRGWQFGGAVKFQGFKIAGAYGDAGRYAGLNTEAVKRTKYWNAGIGFEQDRTAISLTYGDNKKGLITASGSPAVATKNPHSNSFRIASLGGSYVVTKGAAVEGNFTYFKAKDKNTGVSPNTTLNNKGYQAGVQLRVSL